MRGKQADLRLFRTGFLSQPWRRIIFAALVVILLASLVGFWVCRDLRDPVYRGKPLTTWLRTYGSSSSSGRHSKEWTETDAAVRHLGTNAIPVLLRMIRAKDSRLKLRLVALAQKQSFINFRFIPAAERNIAASRAFIALGETAKGAVPALVKMYDEDISADSQGAVADALAWIGLAAKPAIPRLLRSATNSNAKVRANSLWALGEIRAEPQSCVRALICALSDSDDWVRLSAVHALGLFGSDAQAAVPALTEMTRPLGGFMSAASLGIQTRLEARNALKKISARSASPPDDPFPALGMPTTDSPTSPLRD